MDNNVVLEGKFPLKKERDSNFELYRIIIMLLIIAHHYFVNSGLTLLPEINEFTARNAFLWVFGGYGKTGINCFVLLTGYFMCKSQITLSKFLKLLLQIEFYRIVFYIVFLIMGYETFSVLRILKVLIPITSVKQNFTECYLLFFLCIPFLNILVKNMSEKMHIRLLLIVVFAYVFIGTIPGAGVSMNYVSWYVVLYFISSYVRLHPKKIFDNTLLWGIMSLLLLALSAISILVCLKIGKGMYFLLSDSNKALALAIAVSTFMFFKNVKIKNSKAINLLASTTFGVFLIHANSEAMRIWLWKNVLKNVEIYNSQWLYIHALLSPIIIFLVCSVIDMARIFLLEKPFFKWWNKREKKIVDLYKRTEDKICKKTGIGD